MPSRRRSQALVAAAFASISPKARGRPPSPKVRAQLLRAIPKPKASLGPSAIGLASGLPSLVALPAICAHLSSLASILLAAFLAASLLLAAAAAWNQWAASSKSKRARELHAAGLALCREHPPSSKAPEALGEITSHYQSRHVRDREALLAWEAVASDCLRAMRLAQSPEQALDLLSEASRRMGDWQNPSTWTGSLQRDV